MSLISQAQIDQYHREGYFILESAIPAPIVEALRNECRRIIDMYDKEMEAKGSKKRRINHGVWYVTSVTLVVYIAGLQTLPQDLLEAAGTARSLAEFLHKVHTVFLHGLSGAWEGSHNARYAEGRFAVSSGWHSLVAVHNGEFLTIPTSGNTLRWHIMVFWERSDDLLLTNWVHINMIYVFKQMGVDVFEMYCRYRRERSVHQS